MDGRQVQPGSASAWLDWPAGVIRTGVVFVVAVTLVGVVLAYPGAVRGRDARAAQNSALSYTDREIAGGNDLVADQLAAYQARARIPAGETFWVDVGQDYAGGSALTRFYVGDYYRYFLMPRRPSPDAHWIICYGCEPREVRGIAGSRVEE